MSRRRSTKQIVVHCSATQPTQDIGAREIRKWHRAAPNNFVDIGYHFVVRRNGVIEAGRPMDAVGAHARGFNATSISVCLVGGIDKKGKPQNNFTDEQMTTLRDLVRTLTHFYPEAWVLGHRDLFPDRNGDGVVDKNDWLKDCPCFDVPKWWESLQESK